MPVKGEILSSKDLTIEGLAILQSIAKGQSFELVIGGVICYLEKLSGDQARVTWVQGKDKEPARAGK